MKERDIFRDFAKSLIDAPVAIVFLLFDLVGVTAVVLWVVDDRQEAMVFVAFVVIILVGQYLGFRGIRLRLAEYELASPRIKISQSRQAQMYFHSHSGGSTPTYELLQVWFKNNPTVPLESTIAKDVTAMVRISKPDSSEMFAFHGQWAEANPSDNVGYNFSHDTENLPPNHIEVKLMLALKYPADDLCYAFTREVLRSSEGGRSPRYEIPPGDYFITINLRGVGVDDIFQFKFHNPGANKSMELEQM